MVFSPAASTWVTCVPVRLIRLIEVLVLLQMIAVGNRVIMMGLSCWVVFAGVVAMRVLYRLFDSLSIVIPQNHVEMHHQPVVVEFSSSSFS